MEMNKTIFDIEQSVVEQLVPQPQYSLYEELIITGHQDIYTSEFTSIDILNTHFEQVLNILKDGIDLDQVKKSFVMVHFVDNEIVKLSIFDYWFNLIFWGLAVSTGTALDSRYLWHEDSIVQSNIANYINNRFLRGNRGKYSNIDINNMIDNTMYKFQYIDNFSLYLYNTSNNEDTIELMKNDREFNDCIHCDLSGIPIEDVKDKGMEITKKGIQRILKYKNHWAVPYFKSKQGINVKQLREFMFNIGTVSDGNGSVYPYIINGNYCNRGITDISFYDADADKARQAQNISHKNVGDSGFFARILNLNNMDDRLNADPNYICDSRNFLRITIRSADMLERFRNRYFRFSEDGIEYKISQDPLRDNMDLIGQTLLFRSPITCASRARGQGVCYRCYGDLAYTNYDINIGIIASELTSSELTQRQLSAKHLLETYIKKMQWNENFHTFCEIDYNTIKLKDTIDFKKYKIVIDQIDDEEDSSEDESTKQYISSFTIIDPNGIGYVIKTQDDDNLYLSMELEYILSKKTTNESDEYVLDADQLKEKALFTIDIVNNELSGTLQKVLNILNKNSEIQKLKTKDRVTQELVETVIDGGLHVDAIHLEVILSHQCKSKESNLLDPSWEYPNEEYRMISLNEALRDNRSITVSLMYKDINKLLYNPLSFKKNSPSVLDLFYMTKPQEYTTMKPIVSNLVDDREVEGKIRPFTVQPDYEDNDDEEG